MHDQKNIETSRDPLRLLEKAALSELAELSRHVGKALRSFGSVRNELGLTAEEVLIFLAIGQLGLVISSISVKIKPVAYLNVSSILAIPKETVRRKAKRLVDLGLVRPTATGPLVIAPETWFSMASEIIRQMTSDGSRGRPNDNCQQKR